MSEKARCKSVSRRGVETSPGIARVVSRDLMRGERELIIEHDGREYRLRVTARGKLILTA